MNTNNAIPICREPFIIPGCAGRWPAVRRWYLVAVFALSLGLIGCGEGSNTAVTPTTRLWLQFTKPDFTGAPLGLGRMAPKIQSRHRVGDDLDRALSALEQALSLAAHDSIEPVSFANA